MADIPLFDLTADGKFRLAYDSRQWILQQRVTRARLNGPRAGEPSYTGVGFIGHKKTDLWKVFERHGVVLTPEARRQFDALPESYPLFRNRVWSGETRDGFEYIGWVGVGSDIEGAAGPVEGVRQCDLAFPGQIPHGTVPGHCPDSLARAGTRQC